MKKILLILEDFAERAYLSTLLKKVGWDVEIAQTEVGINSVVLSFSPDIILVNAFGKKVKGEFLPHKLGNMAKKPLFFLVTKGRSLTEEQMEQLKVDGFFESPVDVKKLFQDLENVGGIKSASAFQKLSQQRKNMNPELEEDDRASSGRNDSPSKKDVSDESVEVKSKVDKEDSKSDVASKSVQKDLENPQEAMDRAREKLEKYRFADPARSERNAKFLKNNPSPDTEFNGMKKEFVEEQVAEFREIQDDPEIQEIDEERKAFVKAMYEMSKKD